MFVCLVSSEYTRPVLRATNTTTIDKIYNTLHYHHHHRALTDGRLFWFMDRMATADNNNNNLKNMQQAIGMNELSMAYK